MHWAGNFKFLSFLRVHRIGEFRKRTKVFVISSIFSSIACPSRLSAYTVSSLPHPRPKNLALPLVYFSCHCNIKKYYPGGVSRLLLNQSWDRIRPSPFFTSIPRASQTPLLPALIVSDVNCYVQDDAFETQCLPVNGINEC